MKWVEVVAVRPILHWLRKQYGAVSAQKAVVADYKKRMDAGKMLEDLARFCCVYDTTYDPRDPEAIKVNEGKRQVYIHIVEMMSLSDDEIAEAGANKGRRDTRDDERGPDKMFDN
jgi:hypothetical protein